MSSIVGKQTYENGKGQLFKEIKHFTERSDGTTATDPLWVNKIRSYNNIRDLEQIITPNSGRDPLTVFPLEVWEEIIHECAGTFADSPIRWNTSELIKLTDVSKSWQNTILSIPSFWRNVRVDSLTEDLEAGVAMCLHLSNDGPLKIGLQIPTPHWEKLGPIIRAQSYRIRSIFLSAYNRGPRYDRWNTEVAHTLESFNNLPLLQEIIADKDWSTNLDFFFLRLNAVADSSPIPLSRIEGAQVAHKILSTRLFSGIRRLSLPYGFYLVELLLEIFGFSSLLTINFAGTFMNCLVDPPSASPTEQALSWSSASYLPDKPFIFNPLHHELWDAVTHLVVRSSWEEIDHLFKACSEMHCLENLSMRIGYSTFLIPDSSITGLWPVATLDVDLSEIIGYWSAFPDSGDINDSNIIRLFEGLRIAAPFVQDLTIRTGGGKAYPVPYIISLPVLKNLVYITMWNKPPLDLETVTIPSVESATIESSGSDMLNYLCCPGAISLSFCLEDSPPSPHQLDIGHWNNLQKLGVQSSQAIWTAISLPLVKIITFENKRRRYRSTSQTSFCRELARRPTSFPSLECIQMLFFPGWDIFFILLERRNLLEDDQVSPIRTIAFRTLPSPEIVHHIACRLGGRLSARPSNYQLSMLSQMDIYCDPDILGCDNCHRGFIACDKALYTTIAPEPQGHPLYPPSTEELIEVYEDISGWFDAQIGSFRDMECIRCNKLGFEEITAHTRVDFYGSA